MFILSDSSAFDDFLCVICNFCQKLNTFDPNQAHETRLIVKYSNMMFKKNNYCLPTIYYQPDNGNINIIFVKFLSIFDLFHQSKWQKLNHVRESSIFAGSGSENSEVDAEKNVNNNKRKHKHCAQGFSKVSSKDDGNTKYRAGMRCPEGQTERNNKTMFQKEVGFKWVVLKTDGQKQLVDGLFGRFRWEAAHSELRFTRETQTYRERLRKWESKIWRNNKRRWGVKFNR